MNSATKKTNESFFSGYDHIHPGPHFGFIDFIQEVAYNLNHQG